MIHIWFERIDHYPMQWYDYVILSVFFAFIFTFPTIVAVILRKAAREIQRD